MADPIGAAGSGMLPGISAQSAIRASAAVCRPAGVGVIVGFHDPTVETESAPAAPAEAPGRKKRGGGVPYRLVVGATVRPKGNRTVARAGNAAASASWTARAAVGGARTLAGAHGPAVMAAQNLSPSDILVLLDAI